jgi:hypothetical protein
MAKKFTAEEMRTILTMKHNGYKYKEIADKVGRSTKSIEVFCQRNRLVAFRKDSPEKKNLIANKPITTVQQEEAKFLGAADVVVDNDIIGTITPMPVHAKSTTVSAEPVKKEEYVQTKTLDDFTPRQIMKHMYKLGYRVKGELIRIVEQKICLNDIINE